MTISQTVRAGIARGQRYICTFEDCLGVWSSAWCSCCQAPRCDEHAAEGLCATCAGPVVSFAAITETERERSVFSSAVHFIGGTAHVE